jgi:hypothetical protein
MMAHELLRQAALILAAGWSKGSNARDATGRIVQLFAGASPAGGADPCRRLGKGANARDATGRIVPLFAWASAYLPTACEPVTGH